MNTIDKLVLMANQIAANLMHESDPVAATAEHIQLYWDPGMKRKIAEYSGSKLSRTAIQAVMLMASCSAESESD